MEHLKVPSKTFLLGEYAVLYGGPALVLAHSPFFEVKKEHTQEKFHPKSPAALLMKKHGLTQDFMFLDPHHKGGGFGGSTAEVVASLKGRVAYHAPELLEDYFSLFKDQKVKPSGADLYAQWLGAGRSQSSVLSFESQRVEQSCLVSWPFKDIALLIFKRPKKAQTHVHLGDLKKENEDFKKLVQISREGVSNFLSGKEAFFESVEAFSQEQSQLSLLDESSFMEVNRIKKLPYVVAARACGALGMDVVSIFCSLKEDLDKVKAEIVDFGWNYKHVTTLNQGDFISD